MTRMVDALNGEQLRGVGEIRCWTCHAGQVRPARQPRADFQAELARWPAELSAVPDSTKFAMAVYNVALGVTCDHCHDPSNWKAADKKPMKLVPRMSAMFEEFPKYMPEKAQTQCYMCHQGTIKPKLSSLPPAASR
jgi:formate-dependent nitrite reductase cytochrome c552 subunit